MFETDYGTLVCGSCGNENFGNLLTAACSTHSYSVPLQSNATYTRLKRFKKYLNRSTMSQSQNSIPAATWDYLLAGSPYSGPAAIVRRLKKAPKHIRKKCYDSLPLLVHHLCPDIRVPRLSEHEKKLAIRAFLVLDRAYVHGEPFISYLYALEYILELIQRSDILQNINKISCRKRRAAYKKRLNKIFEGFSSTLLVPVCNPV